jgi:hypothetical protein
MCSRLLEILTKFHAIRNRSILMLGEMLDVLLDVFYREIFGVQQALRQGSSAAGSTQQKFR